MKTHSCNKITADILHLSRHLVLPSADANNTDDTFNSYTVSLNWIILLFLSRHLVVNKVQIVYRKLTHTSRGWGGGGEVCFSRRQFTWIVQGSAANGFRTSANSSSLSSHLYIPLRSGSLSVNRQQTHVKSASTKSELKLLVLYWFYGYQTLFRNLQILKYFDSTLFRNIKENSFSVAKRGFTLLVFQNQVSRLAGFSQFGFSLRVFYKG